MGEIKAVNKLRECANHESAGFFVNLEQAFGLSRYRCGDSTVKPSGSEILHAIADEIEAEIADSYMRLPVDADGVPIHMGDTVEGQPLGCSRVEGSVTTYYIHDDDEPDSIYIKVDCGNGTWTIRELQTERCHHVKPRTLEDVLRDFIDEPFMWDGNREYEIAESEHNEKTIKRYADEIRELMGGDAS